MRKPLFLQGAFVLLAAACSLAARAQFQPVHPDELKMTADPKFPGADAEYLDYEESDSAQQHSQSYYARIKVFTEKGKEAATVQLPYFANDFSISNISGRTIHPDGTIVPLNVKPEDLVVFQNGAIQVKQTVFNMPSVEVGSVIEYTYRLYFNEQNQYFAGVLSIFQISPEWTVQRRYPVRKAHYQFLASSSMSVMAFPILPPGKNIQITPSNPGQPLYNNFSLDVTDIPPIPDEEWMPPLRSFLYRVMFYYKAVGDALDPDGYWKAAAKTWSKEIDHFATPSKNLHDAVAGLVAPTDSDLTKAQKLYAAVQALDNTNFSRAKTASERRDLKLKTERNAEDIWTQKSGNRNEIALLYLAMLRAAGLTAYAMQVVDRNRDIFDPSYMSLAQLNSDVVILSDGGKETVLDPGERMCPFATVSWKHSGAEGLRQNANGPSRAQTPVQAFSANAVKRTGDITVAPNGAIQGTLQIAMTGQEALFWRQRAIKVDAQELKKQFDREIETSVPEGVVAHVDHFLGLDHPDKLLLAIVQVNGVLGTTTAKRLILPGFFFQTRGGEPFVSEAKRLEPVDMRYAAQDVDQLTYELPAGMAVEGAPEDAKIPWPDHALYIAKTRQTSGQITVARVLARAFTLAQPGEYQDLRSFYQKVAAAEQAQIVLSTATKEITSGTTSAPVGTE